MARSRRAGMAFILVTLFLDILGLGIIVPVLPHLVTDMLGGDASRAASYYGAIAASYAGMQFLFAPLLGALSDRVGRRPVLLVSLFGFGVNYVILGLVMLSLATIAVITLVFLLSQQLRKGEFHTLSRIGASKTYIATLIASEIGFVFIGSLLLATGLTFAVRQYALQILQSFLSL